MIKLVDVNPEHGNVYITKKGVDERDLSKLKRLDGIRFGNVDQKWYDANGDLYNDIEKYTGKTFWVQMNSKLKSSEGEFLEEVEIKLLYPCGVNTVPKQDIEHILEEDQGIINTIKELGMISGEDDPKFKRYSRIRASAVACLMAPGQKLRDMYGVSLFAVLSVVYDDFLEDNKKVYTHAELSALTAAMADIMNGKEVDMKKVREKIHDHEPEVQRDFLQKALNYVKLQYDDMDSHRHLGVDPIHYITNFVQWMDSIHLEQSKEWLDEMELGSTVYRRAQQELRLTSPGPYITLELILYYKGITIDQSIRDTFLVKWFLNLYGQQAGRTNDIMSFPKEYADGDVGSHVLLHMMDGLPRSKALQKTAEECNDITTQIIQVGNLLIKVHEGNEQVVQLVENVKWILHGHMQWYHYSPRYQPGLVCHCVVEDDE